MKLAVIRVVHLAKFYPPDRGGMEEVCECLAEVAARQGLEVSVTCFVHGGATTERQEGVLINRHSTTRTIASQPLSWGYLVQAWKVLASPLVVHLHAPNMLAALALAIHPWLRARVVVHWHSDVVGKGVLGRLTRPIEWAMLRRASCVVATSPPYAAASEALALIRERLRVIPLGIRDLPQPIREQPERLILAVGRLVPYKGFDVLVSAAALLPSGARVVIAGDGPLRAALQRQIDELGVADRVQLAGRVSEPQLARLYASAAAFCLPSVERSEAFGVVLLEAMRAGLPIVATDLPGSGVPWVNEHGLTGFNVTVGDSSALADALTRLLEDEANRRRMGAAARQRFEAMFIAESTAVAWLELYSELFSALD